MEFPTVEKFVKDVGNLVLDNFTYRGKSLREWVDILSKYECLEWIPCSERLPDCDEWYLTTFDGDICGRDEEWLVGMTEFKNGKWIEDTVYAWMPLPKSYKPKEKTHE